MLRSAIKFFPTTARQYARGSEKHITLQKELSAKLLKFRNPITMFDDSPELKKIIYEYGEIDIEGRKRMLMQEARKTRADIKAECANNPPKKR